MFNSVLSIVAFKIAEGELLKQPSLLTFMYTTSLITHYWTKMRMDLLSRWKFLIWKNVSPNSACFSKTKLTWSRFNSKQRCRSLKRKMRPNILSKQTRKGCNKCYWTYFQMPSSSQTMVAQLKLSSNIQAKVN